MPAALCKAAQTASLSGALLVPFIGQGVDPAEAVRQVGTVEGYICTKNAYELAKKLGVEMPITEQLADVLFNGSPVKDTVKKLINVERIHLERYGA